jgi:hypothetical protein
MTTIQALAETAAHDHLTSTSYRREAAFISGRERFFDLSHSPSLVDSVRSQIVSDSWLAGDCYDRYYARGFLDEERAEKLPCGASRSLCSAIHKH